MGTGHPAFSLLLNIPQINWRNFLNKVVGKIMFSPLVGYEF